MALPLMPKATAVWLIDNTKLTFDQIARFCGLHVLEVKGIADGEVAIGIVGLDPVANGQLGPGEIERCEKDPSGDLKLLAPTVPLQRQKTKGAKYTPVSKRQDRPDAIAWLLKYHPEVQTAQIQKLLGTTKATIDRVKNHTHPNHANIKPRDPVYLGICSQMELDRVLLLAAKRKQNKEKRDAREARIQVRDKTAEAPAEAAATEAPGNSES
ncbi:cell cycle transcriptional regulator TrcR [Ferrovibrio terrae]|uniref:cell cycle transcriptional regulator TrcR n=1 Tax=Ferrovibrio terrae TaxID=2594003 RepID=UPI0031381FCD